MSHNTGFFKLTPAKESADIFHSYSVIKYNEYFVYFIGKDEDSVNTNKINTELQNENWNC